MALDECARLSPRVATGVTSNLSDLAVIVAPELARATVVITTRNRSGDLMKALASCQEQTVAVEVIVIDDASTDQTAMDVRDGFPDATLITNPEPRGYIVGRNHAA